MKNLDKSLFDISIPSGIPAKGSLLIAEPMLREESFNHSVILLVEYSQRDASLGVVLNHKSDYSLSQMIDNPDLESLDIPLWMGGPVGSDRLLFIHSLDDVIPGGDRLAEDLWLGGDFDAAFEYMRGGGEMDGKLRFFLGYCGWSGPQLTEELAAHTWAVNSIDKADNLLPADTSHMWHEQVKRLGSPHRYWTLHPEYPHFN
ncbi:MAG: YqgE/AlgH family protein [Bacteroides sp.]|nr:YqgE/AlgH family protein [Bacteroides sp.]